MDYYDELYFGGGKNEDDGLVGCPSCGMSYAVSKCGNRGGRLLLVDPETRETHICSGVIQCAPDKGEGADATGDSAGEVDFIDYE